MSHSVFPRVTAFLFGSLAALAFWSAQTSLAAPAPPAPGSWFVRLKVDDYANRWKFDATVLGQQPGAAAAWDPQDLPAMPPFAAPYLFLTFPRPAWGARAGDYVSDFRPAGRLTAGDWPFDLRASQIGSTVYLRRDGDPAILKRSLFIDPATGVRIRGDDPRWSGQGVPVRVTSRSKRFIWRYLGP